MDDATTVLSLHDCFELLRRAEVGRLAVLCAGRPDIFPVNHVVDHGTLVFRTDAGTKLAALSIDHDVAFEVDGYDAAVGEAWSVVVKGRADELGTGCEAVDATDLPLFPWHTAPKPRFVRIVPDDVSGRRFHARHRRQGEHTTVRAAME